VALVTVGQNYVTEAEKVSVSYEASSSPNGSSPNGSSPSSTALNRSALDSSGSQ